MINRSAFRVSLFLCATIFTMLSCSHTPEAPDTELLPGDKDSVLYAIKKRSKWGFINNQGKVIVKPCFDLVGDFSEGMIPVKLGGRWRELQGEDTLATENGWHEHVVILWYDHQGGKWGFMDNMGRIVVKPHYNGVGDFSEGLAWVNQGGKKEYDDYGSEAGFLGGKFGFIDRSGREVIKLEYDNAGDFSEGLAAVQVDNKWGFIDKEGSMVIEPRFVSKSTFSEGLAPFEVNIFLQRNKFGYIDEKGHVVIKPNFYHAGSFRGGVALVDTKGSSWWEEEAGWGVIDRLGNFVLAPEYAQISRFGEDRFVVAKDNQFTVVDNEGRKIFTVRDQTGHALPIRIIEGDYDVVNEVFEMHDGFARIETSRYKEQYFYQGGAWGLIDSTGNVVIEPQFSMLFHFTEDRAAFSISRERRDEDGGGWDASAEVIKWGFIDRSGNRVIEPKFDSAEPFSKGLARVEIGETYPCHKNAIGYIDREGDYVWKPTK